MIGTGLGTQIPAQNTTAPICGTSPEEHNYCNPDPHLRPP